MKFKKKLLSEEIGLRKSNRKTFTKGKNQKVVVNEGQLQRLITLISEKETPKSVRPTPTNPNTKKKSPCPGGQVMGTHGCESILPTDKGVKLPPGWKTKELREQGMMWSCEGGQCIPDSISGMYTTQSECEEECGHGFDPIEPTGNDYPTSPLKRMCCRDRNGVITPAVNGVCPKSSTKVKCKKGTPPTQGNMASESRKLKTTNPINESDIKNMKKWFKRVNKAGGEYNPSKK
tara:strand:- start:358 stop:1056 length:699 start_codon:yes stop_codon:yes gene_type:complete